jgi:hypothetical protein
MGTLINFFLGCRHRHQSRPFTLDNRTYTVCLDCGKEIGYSLESMTPLSREQNELKIAKAKNLQKMKPSTNVRRMRIAWTPILAAAIKTVHDDSQFHRHSKDSISNRPLREEIPAQAVTLRRGCTAVAGWQAQEYAAVHYTSSERIEPPRNLVLDLPVFRSLAAKVCWIKAGEPVRWSSQVPEVGRVTLPAQPRKDGHFCHNRKCSPAIWRREVKRSTGLDYVPLQSIAREPAIGSRRLNPEGPNLHAIVMGRKWCVWIAASSRTKTTRCRPSRCKQHSNLRNTRALSVDVTSHRQLLVGTPDKASPQSGDSYRQTR